MAIRIINEVPDKSVLKQAICKMCGITIEYAPIDVKSKSYTMFGEHEVARWLNCPKCKTEITVR